MALIVGTVGSLGKRVAQQEPRPTNTYFRWAAYETLTNNLE